MNQTGYYANAYKTVPYMYALKDYDFETGVHQLNALNSSEASRTLTKDTDGQHTNSSQSHANELRGTGGNTRGGLGRTSDQLDCCV